jgi:hypothetical protein
MRSISSRIFFFVTLVLLLSLLVIGFSLRALLEDYLADNTFDRLENDAKVISHLAASYYAEGSMNTMDFMINLDVAKKVSEADAVICDSRGRILLCASEPFGCVHQGMFIGSDYVRRIFLGSSIRDTGMIQGLYQDSRYICSIPITLAVANMWAS